MEKYDIICIGSGVSALYFGYKLLKSNSKKRVLFITKDEAPGGTIKSKKADEFYWERCASRYFKKEHKLLNNLIEDLKIPTIDAKINVVTKTYDDVIERIYNVYGSDETVNFPNAVLTLYDSNILNKVVLSLGKDIFRQNFNLYAFFENSTSPDHETKLKYGFQSLCNILFEKVTCKYEYIMNHQVNDITICEMDHCNKFLIDGKWLCNKIVFTGTSNQFNNLNCDILTERKELINDLFVPVLGYKCYLQFNEPWWDNCRDIFDGHPILNSMQYYSYNTILIYNAGSTSTVLQSFDDDTLIEYILSQIPCIISLDPNATQPTDKQLNSISKMWNVNNIQEILLSPKALNKCDENIYSKIIANDNFYFLSGNFMAKGGGWVNTNFEVVEEYFDEIVC